MVKKNEAMTVLVDPEKKFRSAIRKALKQVDDLRPAFDVMKDTWFRSNASIAPKNRKGPGKYDDLAPSTKVSKKSEWGFVYPILRASGLLMASLSVDGHPNSIKIINKRSMELGTNVTTKKGVPYPIYHQEGRPGLPKRPFIFIGVEQVKEARATIYQERLKAWILTLEDYVDQVLGKGKYRKK